MLALLTKAWEYFKGNKTTVATWTVGLISAFIYTYNYWDEVTKPNINEPTIEASQPRYSVGDTVMLKLKHNATNFSKATVVWKVFDNELKEKTDFSSVSSDMVIFGTGNTEKTYLAVVSVCYTGRGVHKDFLVFMLVKIGNGPNPPNPNPPNPNPPNPNPPVPPAPPTPAPPSFPNEKYGLSTFTYNEFSKITDVNKVRLAAQFAQILDKHITTLNAGVASATALTNINSDNNKALTDLGVSRQVVVDFFIRLQSRLKDVDNSIGLESPANLAIVLTEIREGYRAIR